MNPKSQVKHTPELNVYTVLSMAERSLEWYSNDGTRQHHAIVLEKTRALIEAAPELLEALKAMRDCGSMEEAERNKLFDKAEAAIHRAEGGK